MLVAWGDWTVEQTRKAAQRAKDAEPPPEWAGGAHISGAQGCLTMRRSRDCGTCPRCQRPAHPASPGHRRALYQAVLFHLPEHAAKAVSRPSRSAPQLNSIRARGLPSARSASLPSLCCFNVITVCREGASRSDPRCASRPRRAGSRGGGHWVRFVVARVPVSPEKPHGIDYSLTLHGPYGERLVGFDNAHPVGRRKRGEPQDHATACGRSSPASTRTRRPCSQIFGRWWTQCCAREE